jgi:carboxypeptidase Q
MTRKTSLMLIVSLLIPLLAFGQEKVDLNVIHKIKTAELGRGGGEGGGGRGGALNSRVMETMYNLTDRYGPRLTNSPQFRAAGDWAVGQLKEWGLSNVHLEKWPTKDVQSGAIPGWQTIGYSGAMVEPTYMPIIGVPVAWTAGTNGPLTADPILAQVQDQA